jgi:hypothetical protein
MVLALTEREELKAPDQQELALERQLEQLHQQPVKLAEQ